MSIEKFLGVEVSRSDDKVLLRQPLLIERIIAAVEFDDKQVYLKPTQSTYILHKDKEGQDCKDQWNYRSIIGMLNYLANTTRPDIIIAVH